MGKTNSFILFGRAFKNAQKDFWVSIQVLFWMTLVMTAVFYFVEHEAQPKEYRDVFDAFVWAITRYIGDPGDFAGHDPITITGRAIYTLIGILKILIFAVPAGLVANGFRKAMEDEKKKEYLAQIRNKVFKCFRHIHSPSFQTYVNNHPEMPQFTYFLAPRKVSVSELETRGLKLSDILDVVNKFPEFRLRNMADAISIEKQPEDRLVIEHYPLNTQYGCCINRHSNITIVASNSVSQVGIGWFAYYLAKLGGFNFISKEVEVDAFEPESFFAMPTQIQVNGMTQKELEAAPKKYKEELAMVEVKRSHREIFLNDLRKLCSGDNTWCITLLSHIKNSTNTTDIHFSYSRTGGAEPTVNDMQAYRKMYDEMEMSLNQEFCLGTEQGLRYPHKSSNLAYKLRKNNAGLNAFSVRVSTDIVCFDSRTHAIMCHMAAVLNRNLNGQGMLAEDAEDFRKRLFGYTEITKYN